MTSKLTREQLTEWVAQLDSDGGCDATDKQLEALIRQSLAAMDSELEELPLDYLQGHKDGLEWASQLAKANHPETGDWLYDDPIELAKAIRKGPDMPPAQPAPVVSSEPVAYMYDGEDGREYNGHNEFSGGGKGIPLYRHAQPAPERDRVRCEHAEWSHATFGNVGPIGPLKHLSKEALEAAAEPDDLSEWADMQFLLWDAQRRAGITDEQITKAMIEKLAVNKARVWPEPKDGEPRLHIEEQPAPVVPDERAAFNAWNNEDNLPIAGIGAKNAAWLAWQARAKLAGNSPVIPEGYVMVPKEMTDEIGEAIAMQANCCGGIALDIYDAMLAAAPHDTPALNSLQSVDSVAGKWIPVSERLPEECGRYWCYVEEQTDLGKSHYQWNCSWNGERWWVEGEDGGIVTHWMPLPAAPQEVNHG